MSDVKTSPLKVITSRHANIARNIAGSCFAAVIMLTVPTEKVAAGSGSEVGNGGMVVECKNPSGASLGFETLDFFESRLFLNFKFDESLIREQSTEILAEVVKRLYRLDPDRALRFEYWINSFMNEAKFLENVKLVPTEDQANLALPEGCSLVQAIIQREPIFGEERRYNVAKEVWDRLIERERAGLILHEVVYREAIALGQTNSRRTRLFVGYLTSNLLPQADAATYRDRLVRLQLPTPNYNGKAFQQLPAARFWGVTSDQDARGGSSSISISDLSSHEIDLTGELGGVLGRDRRAVGFVTTRFPKLILDKNPEALPSKLILKFQNLSKIASQNLDVLTISVTPSEEFLRRVGWDSARNGALSFQADAPLGPPDGQIQTVVINVGNLVPGNRGTIVDGLSASFSSADIDRLGVSIIRTKQRQLDPETVELKPFHLRVSSFLITQE
jgi:hypothetical protein